MFGAAHFAFGHSISHGSWPPLLIRPDWLTCVPQGSAGLCLPSHKNLHHHTRLSEIAAGDSTEVLMLARQALSTELGCLYVSSRSIHSLDTRLRAVRCDALCFCSFVLLDV